MIYTQEQFDELGELELGSLCIDSDAVELNIFNALPIHLQGLAVQWGLSDSVFRDDLLVYLVEVLFKCSWDQYNELEVTKTYFNSEWSGIDPKYVTLNGYNMSDFSETDKENGVV